MSQVTDARIDGNSRVFFVTGDRTAIVDAGNPGSGRKILKALKAAGIQQDRVSLIIITHGHIDHYGSAHELKVALKVPVMAGQPDAGFIERGANAPTAILPAGTVPRESREWKDCAVKVDIPVTEDMSLRNYGIDARALLTPGHTDGSLSVLAGDGGCVTGDFLASLYTIYAGEPGLVGRSLRKLADGGAKYFYPSHAPCVEASKVFEMVPEIEKEGLENSTSPG